MELWQMLLWAYLIGLIFVAVFVPFWFDGISAWVMFLVIVLYPISLPLAVLISWEHNA